MGDAPRATWEGCSFKPGIQMVAFLCLAATLGRLELRDPFIQSPPPFSEDSDAGGERQEKVGLHSLFIAKQLPWCVQASRSLMHLMIPERNPLSASQLSSFSLPSSANVPHPQLTAPAIPTLCQQEGGGS